MIVFRGFRGKRCLHPDSSTHDWQLLFMLSWLCFISDFKRTEKLKENDQYLIMDTVKI